MQMTKEQFLTALGITELSPRLDRLFTEVMAIFETQGQHHLSDAFLDSLQQELNIFSDKLDFVKKSLARVRENEVLARYSFLLAKAFATRHGDEMILLSELPQVPAEVATVDYEMAIFFSQFAFVPELKLYYRWRGVPEQVISDTLADCFEMPIRVCEGVFGREGYEVARCFEWVQYYLNHKILRVGVLNFEMRSFFDKSVRVLRNKQGEYRLLAAEKGMSAAENGQYQGALFADNPAFAVDFEETETAYIGHPIDYDKVAILPERVTLPKSEWELAIAPDDAIINVHIPEAAAFTPENVEKAYREARELLVRCFPEFRPKAYTCFSWLMAGELKDVVKPASNILAFQQKYMRYPLKGAGKAVFVFLFRNAISEVATFTDYASFAEDTSLQKKVKKMYLGGKAVYEAGGIFFDDALI